MRSEIILLALVTSAVGRPQIQQLASNVGARITKYISERSETGYTLIVEQNDGQKRGEVAELKNVGQDNEALSVKGVYSYKGDDGKTYSVIYIADENGFQAEGEHIPPAASVSKVPLLGIPPDAIKTLIG